MRNLFIHFSTYRLPYTPYTPYRHSCTLAYTPYSPENSGSHSLSSQCTQVLYTPDTVHTVHCTELYCRLYNVHYTVQCTLPVQRVHCTVYTVYTVDVQLRYGTLVQLYTVEQLYLCSVYHCQCQRLGQDSAEVPLLGERPSPVCRLSLGGNSHKFLHQLLLTFLALETSPQPWLRLSRWRKT